MAGHATEDTPSVDVILQNLMKRPNVRSTLILSRRDGSIIKASGSWANVSEQEVRKPANSVAPPTSDVDEDNSADREPVHLEEPKLSHTQNLASSIFDFVASAAALGESVRGIEESKDISMSREEAGRASHGESSQVSAGTTSQPDHDVQLLRLRLKKQEVIIFPDPKYLCCVVQDLDKGGR